MSDNDTVRLLKFFGSKYVWSFYYILLFLNYTNRIIVYAVTIFNYGKTCESTGMCQKLLVSFILSVVTTILLTTFMMKYSIKLWVTEKSIKATNIWIYQKLVYIFYFVNCWADIDYILVVEIFCFNFDKVQNN